jgi:V/A-type H+-transporting ATPase subunit K
MLKTRAKFLLGATVLLAGITTLTYVTVVFFPPAAIAAQSAATADASIVRWGFIAAALAAGLSAVAAGIAVAAVGAAAVGAIAEKPELFGRTLVLVGLAEGIAIYGLIIAIMILNRLG